jgi:RimJ/RimL family protein N-acetyltransferase
MDSVEHLPEVQREFPDNHVVSVGSKPRRVSLEPKDLHELRFTSTDEVALIVNRYDKLTVPREETLVFLAHLMHRKDSWFIAAGNIGLIYLTNVVLSRDADLNFLFWDYGLATDRRAAIRGVVGSAFKRFQLPRISAVVPDSNEPTQRVLRDIGFTKEGTIRQGWNADPPVDSVLYGILKNEVDEWPVLHQLISSESIS